MKDLLAKYGKITPLRLEEEAAFRSLVAAKREHPAGKNLIASDYDEPDNLFILESGRLFASCDLANGERAITRLYYSGDIVGTANIPFEQATQTVTVQTPATVYTFPRRNLIEVFTRLPRIAAVFYTFAALESAILNDRLVSVGRMRGRARLASLILEISSRSNLILDQSANSFHLALTQAQIGDAIGLTEVQVNRLFRDLDSDQVIARSGHRIEILDHARLSEIGHFRDRYQDLDLDWFKEDMG